MIFEGRMRCGGARAAGIAVVKFFKFVKGWDADSCEYEFKVWGFLYENG